MSVKLLLFTAARELANPWMVKILFFKMGTRGRKNDEKKKKKICESL